MTILMPDTTVKVLTVAGRIPLLGLRGFVDPDANDLARGSPTDVQGDSETDSCS